MNLTPNSNLQFYKDGFFGYGEEGDFRYFSLAHWIPVLFGILAIVLIYIFREKIKNWKYEKQFRGIFAFVMLLFEMAFFWRLLYVGVENNGNPDLLTKLPLQVCEWTCIVAVFMMLTKSELLFSYCYFVTFTLGLIPLFMPAVITKTGPAYFRYYQFWAEHLLPQIAVFYMMFVHGSRPKVKHLPFPLITLICMALLSIYLNANITGANYFYLAQGTAGASLANIFPENPWIRLGFMALAFPLLCLLVYLPIYFENKKKARQGAL